MSQLENLSPIDFEDLCRDIAQIETGTRFSAFGPGPDGGIDGRHSLGDGVAILQCKHYEGSTFSSLKAAARKEVLKMKKLAPNRYLFFTSQSLTPKKIDELASIFGELLIKTDDIWGRRDIEAAIRRNPEIEKSHIKLWLSSVHVIEKILRSGLEAFTQSTKHEILEDLKVYVPNPSFDEAIEKLENEKILVVSGPPGVGKTTLAKMVAYKYLNDGWEFCAISSLEDGFSRIEDNKPIVFFFDDFLGRIELDRQSLLQRDTALSIFVKRVRRSKNARFILTTRAHIFEEARMLSDHVDDGRLQLAKYLLDVGVYTRKIKSHIFFNHLLISGMTQQHFESLLAGDWLGNIVDHKNYNPRVIASIFSDCLDKIESDEYPKYIVHALQNPDLVWSKPFKALSMRSKNLLIALFFCDQYFGQKIEILKTNYFDLHRLICLFYAQPTEPNDFEEALRSLESGFISIAGDTVTFVNPSVCDFLKAYLINKEFLELFPKAAKRWDWIQNFWKHLKNIFRAQEDLKPFFLSLKYFTLNVGETPTYRRAINNGYTTIRHDDLSLSERASLLFEWWECTNDIFFIEIMLALLQSNSLQLVSWLDGPILPELHWKVDNSIDYDCHLKSSLLLAIEDRVFNILEGGVPSDELVSIAEKIKEYIPRGEAEHVDRAIDNVISYELTETRDAISHLSTKEELIEHIDFLTLLATVTGYNSDDARASVQDRINEIEEEDFPEYTPYVPPRSDKIEEEFTDRDLKSLFSSLIK